MTQGWTTAGPSGPASSLITRRRLVSGAAAGLVAALGPSPLFGFGRAPLRIGCIAEVDGSGDLERELARLGLACRLIPHSSWGNLVDHLGVTQAGGLDGALLPAGSAPAGTVVLAPTPDHAGRTVAAAILWCRALLEERPPRPLVVGRAVACPQADSRLATELERLGLAGGGLRLRELPPAMLVDNVAAGLVDAALVIGPGARETCNRAAARGLACQMVSAGAAAALTPATSIVLRDGLARAFVSARLSAMPYPAGPMGG
jgi:ABC-type nitrate/sulfonate/bicarbonate transport system substrate-binding protein